LDNCKEAALHFKQQLRDATDVLPHATREVIPRTATTTRAFMPACAADIKATEAQALSYGEDIVEEDMANGLCPALLHYQDAYGLMSATKEVMALGQSRPCRYSQCDDTCCDLEADNQLYGQCPHSYELDIKENSTRGSNRLIDILPDRAPADHTQHTNKVGKNTTRANGAVYASRSLAESEYENRSLAESYTETKSIEDKTQGNNWEPAPNLSRKEKNPLRMPSCPRHLRCSHNNA